MKWSIHFFHNPNNCNWVKSCAAFSPNLATLFPNKYKLEKNTQ